MASNFDSVFKELDADFQTYLIPILEQLVDSQILTLLAQAKVKALGEGRYDWNDRVALNREVTEVRQVNKVLLGLQEEIISTLKGIQDE